MAARYIESSLRLFYHYQHLHLEQLQFFHSIGHGRRLFGPLIYLNDIEKYTVPLALEGL